MSVVRNSQLNARTPPSTTVHTRVTSGTMAMMNAVVTSVVASRSLAQRVPSTCHEIAVTAGAWTRTVRKATLARVGSVRRARTATATATEPARTAQGAHEGNRRTWLRAAVVIVSSLLRTRRVAR